MQFTTKTRDLPKEFTRKFNFVEGDESSGVELRFIPDDVAAKARKKFIKKTVEFAINPRTGKLAKVEDEIFDNDGFYSWWIDTLIVGWWGIVVDGEDFPATTYNKEALSYGRHFNDDREFTATIDDDRIFNKFVTAKNLELQKIAEQLYGGKSAGKNS
jgi:hypothetical protein